MTLARWGNHRPLTREYVFGERRPTFLRITGFWLREGLQDFAEFAERYVPSRIHPDIFIAHGIQDPVLPIDQTSRRIVPQLRRAGYDVTYVEFEGVHHVEPENQERAVRWFLG